MIFLSTCLRRWDHLMYKLYRVLFQKCRSFQINLPFCPNLTFSQIRPLLTNSFCQTYSMHEYPWFWLVRQICHATKRNIVTSHFSSVPRYPHAILTEIKIIQIHKLSQISFLPFLPSRIFFVFSSFYFFYRETNTPKTKKIYI